MADILALILPYFGLIFIGFAVARITRQPLEALGWMNTFVVYVALPALFFRLLARTPVEQLTEGAFIVGSVASTYIVFTVMFVGSAIASSDGIREHTMKGLSAAYGNIGYMGPGLALLAFGEKAAVPVALIFCFENMVHFTIVPMMMAVAGGDGTPPGRLALDVLRRILFHPFIIATAAGVAAACLSFTPPVAIERLLTSLSGAAAPCALFAMGVTLALRPLKRMPREIAPIVLLKLVVHPAVCFVVLSAIGSFPDDWIFTAVLMASLPTATNVFVMAQQYGVWVERATASVLATTLVSVVTVTAWLYLMKNGVLPGDLFP